MNEVFIKGSIGFAEPSQEGQNLDFKDIANEIIRAKDEFNGHHSSVRENRKMILTSIEHNRINFIIRTQNLKDLSNRGNAIRALSFIVVRGDYSWQKRYSQSNRMFKVYIWQQISKSQSIAISKDVYVTNPNYFSYINFKDLLEEKDLAQKTIDSVADEIISDDDAVRAFDYLMESYRIGNRADEKTNAVEKIKKILMEIM